MYKVRSIKTKWLDVDQGTGAIQFSEDSQEVIRKFGATRPSAASVQGELTGVAKAYFEREDRERASKRVASERISRDAEGNQFRRMIAGCLAYLTTQGSFVGNDYPIALRRARRSEDTVKVGLESNRTKSLRANLMSWLGLLVAVVMVGLVFVEANNIVTMIEDSDWLPNASYAQLVAIAIPYSIAFVLITAAILHGTSFVVQRILKGPAVLAALAVTVVSVGMLAFKIGTLQSTGLSQSDWPPSWWVSLGAVYTSAMAVCLAEVLFAGCKANLWEYKVRLTGYARYAVSRLELTRTYRKCIEQLSSELDVLSKSADDWETAFTDACVDQCERLFSDYVDELKFSAKSISRSDNELKTIPVVVSRMERNHVNGNGQA